MIKPEHMEILERAFAAGNEMVHVDGWTSEEGRAALAAAEKDGLVKSFVTQGDQYTAINYRLTQLGKLEFHGQK